MFRSISTLCRPPPRVLCAPTRRPTTREARHTLTHAPRRLNTRAARSTRTRQTFARETKKNKNKKHRLRRKEKKVTNIVYFAHTTHNNNAPRLDAKCRSATAQVLAPHGRRLPRPAAGESLPLPLWHEHPQRGESLFSKVSSKTRHGRETRLSCLSRYRQTST